MALLMGRIMTNPGILWIAWYRIMNSFLGPKNCTVMSQVCPLWIDLYGTFNDLQPTANIQWPGRVISKLIPKSSCGTVGHQSQADGILSRVGPFFGALFS